MNVIEQQFTGIGGRFLSPPAEIKQKLDQVHGYIFDWDGVFTNGHKGQDSQSSFSEVDSMGTNLLRLAHWLRTGVMPYCFIISGANNPTAIRFAKREHMHAVCTGYRDKLAAFEVLSKKFNVSYEQCCFVFDDVIDLSLAQKVRMKLYIGHKSKVTLQNYIVDQKLADYISGCAGGNHAIREICDLLISVNQQVENVITTRVQGGELYQKYWAQRNKVDTMVLEAGINQ